VNGQAPRAGLHTSNVRSGVQGDQNKRDVVIGQYAGIVALYGVSVASVAGCSNGVHRLARSGTDRHWRKPAIHHVFREASQVRRDERCGAYADLRSTVA